MGLNQISYLILNIDSIQNKLIYKYILYINSRYRSCLQFYILYIYKIIIKFILFVKNIFN